MVGIAFVLIAAVRSGRSAGARPGPKLAGAVALAIAIVIPIVPWTIHNIVTLDRAVPISTGGGKALYVGTLLPADGEYQQAKALLVKRYLAPRPRTGLRSARKGRTRHRSSTASPNAIPDLPRDQALGKIGKEDFSNYFAEDPSGYAAMTVRKVWRMWSGGVGEAMSATAGRVSRS